MRFATLHYITQPMKLIEIKLMKLIKIKLLKNPNLLSRIIKRWLSRLLGPKEGQSLMNIGAFLSTIPIKFIILIHLFMTSNNSCPGIKRERRVRPYVDIPLRILKEFL